MDDHPLEVFDYASRHGYKDIMALAAELLLDLPLDKVLRRLPTERVQAWVRFTCVFVAFIS